jgi:hypothetical protein
MKTVPKIMLPFIVASGPTILKVLFIKIVFSSCAWVGTQQRTSTIAIVNLCLVQFGEPSRVFLLIHFHLLGKCPWNRCGPFGFSKKKLFGTHFSEVRKTWLAQQTEAEKPGATDDRGTYNGFEAEVWPGLFSRSRACYAVWEFEAMHRSHLGPRPNKARCVLPVHL